jgi:hypothetical protein
MREKPTNTPIIIIGVFVGCLVTWRQFDTHHVTRHNTPIHNILSTAPQLSISQKALETPPEDSNVMPEHVAANIINKLNK